MDTDEHNNDYNCWRENRKRLSVCTRNFSFMTNTMGQTGGGTFQKTERTRLPLVYLVTGR